MIEIVIYSSIYDIGWFGNTGLFFKTLSKGFAFFFTNFDKTLRDPWFDSLIKLAGREENHTSIVELLDISDSFSQLILRTI